MQKVVQWSVLAERVARVNMDGWTVCVLMNERKECGEATKREKKKLIFEYGNTK
jgi:hypothetical protein